MRTVLLVEGASDRIALETLAPRRGQSLSGVRIVSLDGITNAGRAITSFGPHGSNDRLCGLCDAAEDRFFRRALEQAGLGENLSTAGMEQLGFFRCHADLEDELVRSLGVEGVEAVLEREGDLAAFRVFQHQPFHRQRSPEQQLRRFLGTIARRKARYASSLVNALELEKAPRPLMKVLDFAGQEP